MQDAEPRVGGDKEDKNRLRTSTGVGERVEDIAATEPPKLDPANQLFLLYSAFELGVRVRGLWQLGIADQG